MPAFILYIMLKNLTVTIKVTSQTQSKILHFVFQIDFEPIFFVNTKYINMTESGTNETPEKSKFWPYLGLPEIKINYS